MWGREGGDAMCGEGVLGYQGVGCCGDTFLFFFAIMFMYTTLASLSTMQMPNIWDSHPFNQARAAEEQEHPCKRCTQSALLHVCLTCKCKERQRKC